eukprot:g2123.t1
MEEIENAEEGTAIYDQEIAIDGDEYYTANGQFGVNNYDSESYVDATCIEEQKDDNKKDDEQVGANNYDNENYCYYNGNVHTEITDHDQVESVPAKFNDWCPWEKVYDPASESYYFFNIWTSETTWNEPADYFEAEDGDNSGDVKKRTAMPDGLILLKAVKKIQSVYRMKRARRILEDQRKLKTLKTQLEIYEDRCDLWFEQGLICFRKKDYKNTCISLSHAVSNVHIREPGDEELEERQRPKVRRKRHSEFSAFRRKIPQRSESSKLIARFQAKMRKAPGISYLKTKFGYALRILGISYFKIWEDSCKPNDLKLAWDTLQIAHTFIENLTHPEFMLSLAKCHMCQGSFQGALQLLARVIDNAPTWHRLPEVILLSASLLKTGGKLDQSKQYFTYILDSPYIKGRQFGKYLVNFSLANIYLTENDADEMLKEESLILPLKKTACSFYVNRSMPHLRPKRRKKKFVYTSTKTLPPLIHDHHQYFNSQILQPSDILQEKNSVRIKKPVPQYTLGEVRDMRALIAKRQQKVATRHDLFHKHGINKRRLRNSTRKLESLLL